MICSQSVTPLVMPYRWMGRTLKGAARAIGAWQVADAADLIEQQLAVPGSGPPEASMDALTLAAAEARAAIARFDCAA